MPHRLVRNTAHAVGRSEVDDGDHDGVWRDLRALGLDVFGARHREDARAVAHEMASRARRNVEMLVERLQAEGFNAAWNDDDATPRPPHFPPTDGASALADRMEEAFAPLREGLARDLLRL